MKNLSIVGILCLLIGILVGYILFYKDCSEMKSVKIKESKNLNYKQVENSKKMVVKLAEDIKKVKLKSIDSIDREVKRVQTLDTNCKQLVGELYDQNKKRDTIINYQKIQIDTLISICDQYKLKTDTLQKSNDSLIMDVNTNYSIAENYKYERDEVKNKNKTLNKIIVIGGIVLGTIIVILL